MQITPVLGLLPHHTAEQMRSLFAKYERGVKDWAQRRLSTLIADEGADVKPIVDEASTKITEAAVELTEGLRLRALLRGSGGFR